MVPGSSAAEQTVVPRQVDGSNPFSGSHSPLEHIQILHPDCSHGDWHHRHNRLVGASALACRTRRHCQLLVNGCGAPTYAGTASPRPWRRKQLPPHLFPTRPARSDYFIVQKGHQRSAFHRRWFDFISINVNYCGYLVLDHKPTPVGKYRNRPRASLRLSLIRTVLSHDETPHYPSSGDWYWECKTIANRTGSS